MTEQPSIQNRGDALEVRLPDGDTYRVVTWDPPRLLLERDGERRLLHVASDRSNFYIGDHGVTHTRSRSRGAAQGEAADTDGALGQIGAPMPGKVLEVLVSEGDRVEKGQRLLVLEAMKMESPLRAPADCIILRLEVQCGDAVEAGQPLLELGEVD